MDNGHFSKKKMRNDRGKEMKNEIERKRERKYKTIEKRMLPNSRI